jgi:hypothetical protein
MSAEEMRAELESFVNQGLEEGWRGWPTRSQTAGFDQWRQACGSTPAALALFRGVREDLLLGSSGGISAESRPHRLETWLS